MKLPLTLEALAALRCPTTKQPLHVVEGSELEIWQAIQPADGYLVTEEGSIAYPIDDGYPILLNERAVKRSK